MTMLRLGCAGVHTTGFNGGLGGGCAKDTATFMGIVKLLAVEQVVGKSRFFAFRVFSFYWDIYEYFT
jgi:hypothetical protein